MHQMKTSAYRLKKVAYTMMGYGKRGVSGALHYFGLPGNYIAADSQLSKTTYLKMFTNYLLTYLLHGTESFLRS